MFGMRSGRSSVVPSSGPTHCGLYRPEVLYPVLPSLPRYPPRRQARFDRHGDEGVFRDRATGVSGPEERSRRNCATCSRSRPLDQPRLAGIIAAPLVMDDTVFFGTRTARLWALDAVNLRAHVGRAVLRAGQRGTVAPVGSDGVVFVGTEAGQVWKIDAATGTNLEDECRKLSQHRWHDHLGHAHCGWGALCSCCRIPNRSMQ